MAGDWIKVELSTPDKPEIMRIATLLGIDQDAAFGKCLRVWMWADQQTQDGCALSATFAQLDRIAYQTGFAAAMRDVGWLHGSDGNLKFPNFQRHNGESAKSRSLAKDRMKRIRCADSATKAQPEKRREEINTPLPPASGGNEVSSGHGEGGRKLTRAQKKAIAAEQAEQARLRKLEQDRIKREQMREGTVPFSQAKAKGLIKPLKPAAEKDHPCPTQETDSAS